MIRLEVEEYCHQCPDFEPDVSKPETYWAGNKRIVFAGDAVVRCEHRDRCREIARFFESRNKEQNE